MTIDEQISAALSDLFAGRLGADDRLGRLLMPDMLEVATSMVGFGVPGPEDVVQDSLLAVLRYLEKRGEFTGRVSAFAVTVVKNRCRDLLRQQSRSVQQPIEDFQALLQSDFMHPMDTMIEEEVEAGLAAALQRLDEPCRDLLVAVFYEERSLEELKVPLGLNSVQAMYYRKKKCLEKLRKLFKTESVSS